jgi:hypothetical protein
MTLIPDRLTEIIPVPLAAAVLYANPRGQKCYIKSIIAHNKGAAPVTLNLHYVPDADLLVGVAAAANRFISEIIAMSATAKYEFIPPGIVLLHENDTIQASASVANDVTIQMYGIREEP